MLLPEIKAMPAEVETRLKAAEHYGPKTLRIAVLLKKAASPLLEMPQSPSSTIWALMRLVVPDWPRGTPAVMTTVSPDVADLLKSKTRVVEITKFSLAIQRGLWA